MGSDRGHVSCCSEHTAGVQSPPESAVTAARGQVGGPSFTGFLASGTFLLVFSHGKAGPWSLALWPLSLGEGTEMPWDHQG